MDFDGCEEWLSGDAEQLAASFAEFELIPADAVISGEYDDSFVSPAQVLAQVASLDPGPDAVALLCSLDGQTLTPGEALGVAGGWERQARWITARQAAAMVGFVGATLPADADRAGVRAESSRVLELGLTVDVGPDLTRTLLAQARLLTGTLTATGRALQSGAISGYRARRISEALGDLPPDTARAIEARLLPGAGNGTVTNLRRRLARARLKAQGPQAATEYAAGAAGRSVTFDTEASKPGLLRWAALLPPEQTLAIRDTLEAKAEEFKRADRVARDTAKHQQAERDRDRQDREPVELPVRRTKDQRLADAVAWFILGPHPDDNSRPAKPTIRVQVTINLPTLLHLQEHPGELGAYGPIPPDIARELATDSEWQRFVHEPVTGYLLDQGNTIYTPGPQLRSFSQARDVRCRFPGSRRSATNADFDHVQPFAKGTGGSTSATNGASLSKLGHIAKTHNNWHVTGNANGALTWTSPNGATYTTTPHDYRADPGPPPF